MILKKYHELIGQPYIPPFCSLGYHQCRFGWKNLETVKEVYHKLEEYDIPADAMWGDNDTMKKWADFAISEERYGGLGQFIDETLHHNNVRYAPIVDAGMTYNPTNKYAIFGEKKNAHIKSAIAKKSLIGKVWPGLSVLLEHLSNITCTVA